MAYVSVERDVAPAFTLQVPAGTITGWSSVNKFGRNVDVDSGANETVWDGGGLWTSPSGSGLLEITSTNAADSSNGAGARTITLQGLNSAGLLSSETVETNGTSSRITTSSFSMIHRMFTVTAGSSESNQGTIAARFQSDTTTTLASMSIGNNQTLMAIYRVPADKTAFMTQYYSTINKGGAATNAGVNARLEVQSSVGAPWQLKHVKAMTQTANAEQVHMFDPAFKINSLSTIRINMDSDTASVDIAAGFDLYLRDN